MPSVIRGIFAGIVAGFVLGLGVRPLYMALAGPMLGFGYARCIHSPSLKPIDHAFTTAGLALPVGFMVHLIVRTLGFHALPQGNELSLEPLLYSALLWIASGFLFGTLYSLLDWPGPERQRQAVDHTRGTSRPTRHQDSRKRIVVLGGGFAGFNAIQTLEKCFGPDPGVQLTMVSNSNSMLFTPMLPEVAGGSVEPGHISSPLRTSFRRTNLVQGSAKYLDTDTGKLLVEQPKISGSKAGDREQDQLFDQKSVPYDHLVLTLGSVPFYMGEDALQKYSFDFKTLQDAMELRNHSIQCLERADAEVNDETRESLLTFVIAGAGFAGAELAGAMNDLLRGIKIYFPGLQDNQIRTVIVEAQDRILPELSESLAQHSREQMEKRGVSFKLGTYVEDAEPGAVHLSSGETLRTQTFIWTAGNRPHPFVEFANLPTNDREAVQVDESLSVPERENVWAAGDCAAVTDAKSGEPHPPTAQHAVRQGKTVARNVHASIQGREPESITYESQGQLCVIGYQTASAEIGGWCFSGFFAWLLWRFIYLFKLPGADRKIRVSFDWLTELFFSRDLVQTLNGTKRELESHQR